MNLNRFTLIGRLTKEVEKRTTPGGTTVANINIATNYSFKDNAGAKVEKTDFHRLTVFGKLADIIAQYCVKGQEMMFEGRISYSNYEKDGAKVYRTDLIVTDFSFGAKAQGAGKPAQPRQAAAPDNRTEDVDTTFPTSGQEDINVEDIPF